jgi:hypothetical protein
MAKASPFWADDGDVFRRRFFLGSVNRSALVPLCGLSSWVKTWTVWSGDGGANGVAFLVGGVVLEDCARSVYCGGQRHSEEGGGLVEDSSLQCQQWSKAVRRRAVAWCLEGFASTGSGPRSWREGRRGRRPRSWQGGRRGRWWPADLNSPDDLRGLALWRLFPARGGILTDSWRTCVALLSLMRQLGPKVTVYVLCV